MKTLQFRCKLQSDVILNVKAATEGNQNTLDYIPGSNFLGIAAAGYKKYDKQQQLDLFHNGIVRYGDAHPVNHESNVRSLRVPASMFYPKLLKIEDKCYILHAYDRDQDHEGENGGPQQLKQSRNGFYEFSANEGVLVDTCKSFAIKSAYNREERRAMDSQMFGYESLCKGMEFLFEVETDKDEYCQVIIDALVGKKQIGRSRTAQYGLVEITYENTPFSQPASTDNLFKKNGKTYAIVYADSRLIFLDENGEPTLQPSAEDLKLEGRIEYALSQVRTFQYAPWNYKRQTRDTDRCGIEKGSVLVIELPEGYKTEGLKSKYVGHYNNEGFGRVIYNPAFLEVDKSANGLSAIKMKVEPENGDGNKLDHKVRSPLADTPLLNYLEVKRKEAEVLNAIYRRVNEFVECNGGKFHGSQFASQWGAIRSIATTSSGYEDLMKELFSNEVDIPRVPSPDNPRTSVRRNKAYLAHGVAADRWKKQGRKTIFEAFVREIHKDFIATHGDITVLAVVNLASEMAKICKMQ